MIQRTTLGAGERLIVMGETTDTDTRYIRLNGFVFFGPTSDFDKIIRNHELPNLVENMTEAELTLLRMVLP